MDSVHAVRRSKTGLGLILSGLLVAGLSAGLSSTAEAHHPARHGGYHHYHYGDRHYVPHARGYMPRWMRRDIAFRHWLRQEHLRHMHRMKWKRLYRLYSEDRYFHRHGYSRYSDRWYRVERRFDRRMDRRIDRRIDERIDRHDDRYDGRRDNRRSRRHGRD